MDPREKTWSVAKKMGVDQKTQKCVDDAIPDLLDVGGSWDDRLGK